MAFCDLTVSACVVCYHVPVSCEIATTARGGSRIFERGGGSRLGLQAKRGGGADGGSILGPMLKSLHRGTKGGGQTPWTKGGARPPSADHCHGGRPVSSVCPWIWSKCRGHIYDQLSPMISWLCNQPIFTIAL